MQPSEDPARTMLCCFGWNRKTITARNLRPPDLMTHFDWPNVVSTTCSNNVSIQWWRTTTQLMLLSTEHMQGKTKWCMSLWYKNYGDTTVFVLLKINYTVDINADLQRLFIYLGSHQSYMMYKQICGSDSALFCSLCTASFQLNWTKSGMQHPYTLQMVKTVFLQRDCVTPRTNNVIGLGQLRLIGKFHGIIVATKTAKITKFEWLFYQVRSFVMCQYYLHVDIRKLQWKQHCLFLCSW